MIDIGMCVLFHPNVGSPVFIRVFYIAYSDVYFIISGNLNPVLHTEWQ